MELAEPTAQEIKVKYTKFILMTDKPSRMVGAQISSPVSTTLDLSQSWAYSGEFKSFGNVPRILA